jgi:FtsP/CotA-like multicopper oxidase with cupredoxin domain
VPGGVTLHWHGVDVPNAMDGVTQDAVGVGAAFTYRFVADQVGTFWYHSHQLSPEQVRGGLLGALVVTPTAQSSDVDVVALVYLYQGARTVNGSDSDVPVEAEPGRRARVTDHQHQTKTPLRFDPDRPDRQFRYDIGRRPGFIDGRPGLFWTINGHLYPDVPMFVVSKGDVVRMSITNHSGEVHPMHLHGHHVVVLSRNGVPATGSQWWVDSLNVGDGESYEIAFVLYIASAIPHLRPSEPPSVTG